MITVITLTRNEKYLVPFFLRHYKKLADHIVVFDNQSNDGTPELLAEHHKVTIAKFDTGGLLRDDVHAQIKSTAYRSMGGDWFLIVDFDEFLWHPKLRAYLDTCAYKGWSLPLVDGYSMVGEALPEDDGKTPLTQLIRQGVPDPWYSKRCVVHRSAQVSYGPGCHGVTMPDTVAWSPTTEIKLLHYNWLSLEYGLEKRRRAATQLSPENLRFGWGKQVLNLDAEQKAYEAFKAKAAPVI